MVVAVVFVAMADPSGVSGQDVATKEIAAALGRHPGMKLTLVCPKPTKDLPPELAAHVSRALFLPPKRRRSLCWQFRAQLALFRCMRAAIRDEPPNLVVARWAPSLFVAPVVAKMHGLSYVLLVRGVEGVARLREIALWPGSSVIARLSLRLNVRLADAVLVAYNEVNELVSRLKGRGRAVVEVFPNAVDPNLFPLLEKTEARSRVTPQLGIDNFVVGFVGSMHERHCLQDLVLAVAQLNKRGYAIKLLFVGTGGHLPLLKELAAQMTPPEAVLFTGFVPHNQVVNYMAACDVLYGVVNPERRSNPIKCYEYLASGRPIITSKTRELEFVEKEAMGVVLNCVNPKTVEEAILAFAGMDDEAQLDMGRRGRNYVLARYTWDKLVTRILTLSYLER